MKAVTESVVWALAFVVLAVLAVPWFLWGVDATVAGLPIWLWWHVGWLVLTTGVFFLFTRSSWGIWTGVESDEETTGRGMGQ